MTQAPHDQFGNIFDLDNYTDAVKHAAEAIADVATSVADQGKFIGGLLKAVAPVLSMVPGLGTAFAVAVYAAGAVSAADRIEDSAIGMASAAMPPGLPRIAFDGGTNIARDVAEGRNVLDSSVAAMRNAAGQAGGPQAVAAFDSGLAVFQGGRVDQRLIDEGRSYALLTGGQSAAASFDAGVAIVQGRSADQVMLEVTRNYVRDMGGATAAAAFDSGVALLYGKTLQEAGYEGLHAFVKGNDGIEKILKFVEQVGRARSAGMALQTVLESDLFQDVHAAIKRGGMPPEVTRALKPVTDLLAQGGEGLQAVLDTPAGQLAQEWGVDEALARLGVAVLRDFAQGIVDSALLERADRSVKAAAEAEKEAAAARMAARIVKSAFSTTLSVGPLRTAFDGRDLGMLAGPAILLASAPKTPKITATVSRALVVDQGETEAFVARGRARAQADARIKAGRALGAGAEFLRGFDTAVGAATGMSKTSPALARIEAAIRPINPEVMRGFSMGQAIAFGVTKADALATRMPTPGHAAGLLVTQGLTKSGMAPAQKAAAMSAVASDRAARQGAQVGISQVADAQSTGLWARLMKLLFG